MSVQARRNSVDETLENALDYRPEEGVVRVNRKVFTDQELFDLEMRYIFEGNWIFLAHESQIPNVGDYYTTNIGRQPIMITRSKDGELNALINACSHRGAMLCRRKTDNRTTITCPSTAGPSPMMAACSRSRTKKLADTQKTSARTAATTCAVFHALKATAASSLAL